jgi:hypothetical protein
VTLPSQQVPKCSSVSPAAPPPRIALLSFTRSRASAWRGRTLLRSPAGTADFASVGRSAGRLVAAEVGKSVATPVGMSPCVLAGVLS